MLSLRRQKCRLCRGLGWIRRVKLGRAGGCLESDPSRRAEVNRRRRLSVRLKGFAAGVGGPRVKLDPDAGAKERQGAHVVQLGQEARKRIAR